MIFGCICFDAPANGRSGMLPVSEITLDRAAHATKTLIQKLELWKFTLIVHDLGGISGLAGAARVPGRVQGVVAMNTFAWKPDLARFRYMLRIMGSAPIRELDALSNFMGWIGSSGFAAGRHFDQASRRAFRTGSVTGRRRPFHSYMREALRCDHLYQEIGGALRGSLAHVPFLTIFGQRNDPFGFQKRWKELIPEVTQHIVPHGNHFPMCDAPDLVAETIYLWHKAKIANS
jgi:haloalkane dehalogenase